jgi:hypothetical protein
MSPRRAASRSGPFWVLLGLAVAAYSLGLAVGPRLEAEAARAWCQYPVDLPGPFGILLNCDSPAFVDHAVHPGRLLEEGNVRQSRPGQIWLAWLVSRPLQPLAETAVALLGEDRLGIERGHTRTHDQMVREGAAPFAAYYLINLVLLAAAVWLVREAVGGDPGQRLAAGLTAGPLVFNDVTKAFLLTPHNQLMNVLLPVLLAVALFRWIERGEIPRGQVLGLCAIAGLGLLAYATWAMVPPFVLVASLLVRAPGSGRLAQAARVLRWLPGMLVLAYAPYAGWYLYVLREAGSFYQHEMALGHLVWVQEVLGPAPWSVAGRLALGALGVVGKALLQAAPFATLVLPAAVAVWVFGVRLPAASRQRVRLAAGAAAVTSAFFLAFFSLTGFAPWRLAFTLLPAWVLPCAAVNAALLAALPAAGGRRTLLLSLTLTAVVTAGYHVVKDGPWG